MLPDAVGGTVDMLLLYARYMPASEPRLWVPRMAVDKLLEENGRSALGRVAGCVSIVFGATNGLVERAKFRAFTSVVCALPSSLDRFRTAVWRGAERPVRRVRPGSRSENGPDDPRPQGGTLCKRRHDL